jgi:hypothetical protein
MHFHLAPKRGIIHLMSPTHLGRRAIPADMLLLVALACACADTPTRNPPTPGSPPVERSRALPEIVPAEELEAHELDLLEYHPLTACLVREVMGAEDYAAMLDVSHRGGLIQCPNADWRRVGSNGQLTKRRIAGGVVRTHCYHQVSSDDPAFEPVEGQVSDHSFLWIDPMGRVIVGQRSGSTLVVHTNLRDAESDPPPALRAWLSWNGRVDAPVRYHARGEPGLPPACAAARGERGAYLDAEAGRSCELSSLRYYVFAEAHAVVERACPSNRPGEATAPAGCIEAGALVQLRQVDFETLTRDGRVCAYHRAPSGREQVGWIPATAAPAAAALDEQALDALGPARWPAHALARSDFPGRYHEREPSDDWDSRFALLESTDRVVRFDADHTCLLNFCPVERPMRVERRGPRVWSDGPEAIRVVLFDNAMLLTLRDLDLEQTQRFIYYPVDDALTLRSDDQ